MVRTSAMRESAGKRLMGLKRASKYRSSARSGCLLRRSRRDECRSSHLGSVAMEGTTGASSPCRRCGQGQPVQRDEPVDIETLSDVATGKHEGDGHVAAVAPLEYRALALGENFPGDP